MRLLLLLVALGWCSLVAAQDLAVDYDYYDLGVEEAAAPTAGDTPATAEDIPLSPDEPADVIPVTEVTTEKTTTTEADVLKGRRKLVSVVRPGNLDRRRRPSLSDRRSLAGPAGTSTTTEEPSTDVRGGSNRFRRPSRRQQTETQTESATEAATPARSSARSRFRPSSSSSSSSSPTSSPSSSGFSPRRTFSRSSSASVTTEAPEETSHRFSPRRRFRPQASTSTNDEGAQEETATQTAPNRPGNQRSSQRRLRGRPLRGQHAHFQFGSKGTLNNATTTTAATTTTTSTTTTIPTTEITTTETPPPTTTTTTMTPPPPPPPTTTTAPPTTTTAPPTTTTAPPTTTTAPPTTTTTPPTTMASTTTSALPATTTSTTTTATAAATAAPTTPKATETPTTVPTFIGEEQTIIPTTEEFTDDIFTTQLTLSEPQTIDIPTTTEYTPTPEPMTATPARPSPVPRIVEDMTTAPRTPRRRTTTPLPRIFRPLVVRTTTTPEPEPLPTTTTSRPSRRGSSRYTPPPDPTHPIIETDVASLPEFAVPLSVSVQAGTRITSPADTDNEVNGRHVTESPHPKVTRGPTTEAPVLTTTQSSKYPQRSYGQSDVRYAGGEVVITEIGTVEDTPQNEVLRILGGLGSRRRGLGRPQKPPKQPAAPKSPPTEKKVVPEETVDDYYDDYYYDY